MSKVVGLADARGCQKPGCSGTPLNRHHRRHEALWFGVWAWRHKQEGALRKKWKDFIDRYHEFREEDTELVCEDHHAEIHSIYDKIIAEDKARLGRALQHYTWPQAEALMRKLERACDKWLKKRTPGISSLRYGQQKKARRAVLNKRAQRR